MSFSPFAGATHDDAAFDLVEIEGVRGLAHGEPREVGGVDGVVDEFFIQDGKVPRDSGKGQVKRVMDGDVPQDTRSETTAGVFGFDPHAESFAWPRFRQREIQLGQGQAVNCRRLTSNAVMVHGVDAIGGNVHFIDGE